MKQERFPASTLFDEMNKCHETGNHRVAVIVFFQKNWKKEYSEESRSYTSHSDQWGWDFTKSGRCRLGSCLDGTDNNVRLDYYDWEVESWYWLNEE